MKTLYLKSILALLFVLAFDQLHKWYMLEIINIDENPPIIVTSYFNLVMVWNRGITFGMFRDFEYAHLFFSLLAVGIVVALMVWLKSLGTTIAAYAIGIICGGALGNVIDRVRFGAVADFFDFHYQGASWPAFNIADSAVFIGAVLLCIDSILARDVPSAKPKTE